MSKKRATSKPNAGVDVSTELTPGQILTMAREKQGMDIPFAASELRLTEKYVRALEENDYEALPARPFVIGYLKSYAKLLSVSADDVIRAFRATTVTPDDPSDSLEQVHAPSGFGPNDLRLLIEPYKKLLLGAVLAIVAVTIIALLVSWMTTDSEPAPPADIKGQAAASQPQSELDGGSNGSNADVDYQQNGELNNTGTDPDAANSAIATAADGDSLLPQTALSAEAENSEPAVVETSEAHSDESDGVGNDSAVTSETSLGEAAPSDLLAIHFTADCWLEVVDSSGKTLTKNLYRRGDRIALQGSAPFSVLFGNALVANVQLNGKSVTLEPREGRKSLRTRIGES